MIDNLKVSCSQDGLTFTISTETRDVNLPYNLADLFFEIISMSDANEDIVIEQLIDKFGYKGKEK